jgi:hypothetical protein
MAGNSSCQGRSKISSERFLVPHAVQQIGEGHQARIERDELVLRQQHQVDLIPVTGVAQLLDRGLIAVRLARPVEHRVITISVTLF